jgi:hypothetical protein
MKNICAARITLLCAIGILILIPGVSASGGISAYIGDTISLEGYSSGSTDVYLFLTGPNLPVNGVSLQDITARADTGHFTIVHVNGNDLWTYSWSTKTLAGHLDAGTYTVWVVTRPQDRSRLANADYSTISITLGKPSITLDLPGGPGALAVRTSPDDADVEIDGVYRGKTPLTISPLEPGTYQVTFSKTGFSRLSATTRVDPGKTTEVTGKLLPFSGSLNITTNPPGARLRLDSEDTGISPILLSNLTAGNYTLTVSKENFRTTGQQVTVINGSVSEITVLLQSDSPAVVSSMPAAGPAPGSIVLAVLAGLLSIMYWGKREG